MEIKNLTVGPLLTNCYILFSGKEASIIDPGGGVKNILKETRNRKLNLKHIILTHHHWDHSRAALKIKKQTGTKILIHKDEKEFLKFTPDKFLEENDKIKIGDNILQVLHTPGHTPGSICLLGKDFVFTGDTLFKQGTGRTDLKGGCPEDLEKSLQKLSKILKPGMKIYPGHGEIFEIEK